MNVLRGVLGDEISLLQYELRRHPRFALPWSPDAAFGAPIDQSLGSEHPIICDLKTARKLCMAQTLTMSKVLEPFLTVVTSEIVNSAITSTALACVERLVTECELAMKEDDFPDFKFAEGLDDVVDSCKSCTFEAVDSAKDDAAHIRRAKVAARSVLAGLPDNISDATILTAFEICLQLVFSKRASDVLRREAEEWMLKIVQGACGMDFNQDEYCDEEAVFSLDAIRKCLKDQRESNQQAADFSFEQTGVEPSFLKPPSVVPQHAFLTLGALLSDPSVTRTARERLVGLRLLNAAVRSLPKDCHPLPRQVLLSDASIAVLRCLGSVPPPPAVVLCSAMSTTGSICRMLGDSAAAFLFILLRTVFSGFTQMKSHAVLRELYLESIGTFIAAPGLLASVFAAIDCEPQLPVVAEGFLNLLESTVRSEFPLVVKRSSSSSELSSVMDVIASTDLQDIVHMEMQPLASDPDESNAAEEQVVSRAVSVITAKIMLDVVESICIRHKAFSQGRGQKVESSVSTVKEVTAKRRAQRAEKKKLRAVAEVFNAEMGKGTGEKVLKLVMESPIVPSNTSGTTVSVEERDCITVAQFLRMTPDLDKSHIGVVLGEPDEFSTCVLAKYTETFSFANVSFTDAIRIYLESFRLPGEAQKISRIMSSFADRYYKQNEPFGGPLSSADATYVLSYAVVMLNTDRHNDSVKKKMTVDDFVRNNRGINDGKDLDRGFLEGIYSSISEEEIKMSDEAGMDALTRAHWHSLLLEFGVIDDPHRSFSDHKTIVLPKDTDLHDEDVFRIICNGSIHAAFALLDEAEDTTEAQSALEGFTLIAKCAASYRIPNAIDLVIIMLASASKLRNTSLKGSVREFGARIKAQMSAVSLFAVARQSADWMRSGGWQAFIDCVLSLHALDLLPAQLESDLCTYGDDIVDSEGNPPPPSKNIPSWWPARRLNSRNSSNEEETARTGKAGNGIWSIFGGGGSNTDTESESEDIDPPEHLLLKSPEELKARELARNCILALVVEELIINETRFIRSDSLACLCSAISDSAPIACGRKRSSGASGSEKCYKENSNGLNLDAATGTSVAAFCIDWLCLVTLKNRDRLGLTWPHLFRLLMNCIHGRNESGPLVERALAAVFRICLRFLHRDEIRTEALTLVETISKVDVSILRKVADWLSIALYQLVKVQAVHLSSRANREAVFLILEKTSSLDKRTSSVSLETLDLITRENLNWFTDDEDLFQRLCRSLGTVLRSRFHTHSSLVDEILLRLRSHAESETGRGATPKQELYKHYWKPWIKLCTNLVIARRGEIQEQTMVMLERTLSSESCEKALRSTDWKDLFSTILVPFMKSEMDSDDQEEILYFGRIKLRGVMVLSRTFLLQYTRIYDSVNREDFLEMWKAILGAMEYVSSTNVKDANDYIPESVKNMVLVLAASKILIPQNNRLWNETQSSVSTWFPDVGELISSVEASSAR
ncbi:hypothetical protein NDN08_007633 [Rhodosorus marinus]|uniref:SEC7 domain-containing protein n=1 Tax=Rhodosorus marinus TaxID=101924 RepID=A0AAV8V2B5_9RHOD|nr:hypothetical protein NDN08_007633 [Rhodosorus marinus]